MIGSQITSQTNLSVKSAWVDKAVYGTRGSSVRFYLFIYLFIACLLISINLHLFCFILFGTGYGSSVPQASVLDWWFSEWFWVGLFIIVEGGWWVLFFFLRLALSTVFVDGAFAHPLWLRTPTNRALPHDVAHNTAGICSLKDTCVFYAAIPFDVYYIAKLLLVKFL